MPSNYLGVNLTNILRKIVERAIASVLVPFLDSVVAFGSDQWGFRTRHSYLSDISVEFDRADHDISIEYLR